MPVHDGQPAQDVPGWRLWVSATGRHWAIRCATLTAAQIAAGARPLLWAEDHARLAALIRAQQELTAQRQPHSTMITSQATPSADPGTHCPAGAGQHAR